MAFLKSNIHDGEEEEDFSVVIKQLNAASCGGDNRARTWSWRILFQIFATVVISLLFPISFLLLARLSAAGYLSSVDDSGHHFQFPSVLANFLFIYNGKSIILCTLVAAVTVAAFIHGLTATWSPTPEQPVSGGRHPAAKIYSAWFIIFMFQVYVGVGIGWSIFAGVNASLIAELSTNDISVIIARTLLFVGLHETMSFWSKYVVKLVVEDTVGGGGGGGGSPAAERVSLALSFGVLWWFRLRDEVDALILAPELILRLQRRPDAVVAAAEEFYGWWLYAFTVLIGSIRVLKGIIWVVTAVFTSTFRNDVVEISDSVPQQSSHHQLPPLEDVV
ncbi:OLC1v1004400C1 [Oldenlandia corymbosa var. corymbosa]|uniref:OLC1v1004400C1 n=1 Tax=Oldenlandia corymbosa var. corymbosa TaxID=529605 RepID=A0AAV1DC65_OLDCO|nr:OLC1v1004400C1 [Oldenlandia corymbosa var. corymbosa]